MIQQVNVVAMEAAADFVAGTGDALRITELYQLIDKAMHEGYQLGVVDGAKDMEDAIDEAFDEGWCNGYNAGEADGLADGYDDGYSDGYVDGVADARARPEQADASVAELVADYAQFALNGEFDADLVTDSGDVA